MKSKVKSEAKETDPGNTRKDAELLLREGQCSHDPPQPTGKDDEAVAGSEALDGGWGWCVVLAGTVCMMVLVTQGPCFGVLYGRRLVELDANPSLATWLFNIQSLIWNLAGPWARPLTAVFSYRTVAVTGGLLAASSLFLSPLVTEPYLLILSFSVLVGVGGGLCTTCCYHVLAHYFSRRLGLANCIVVSGGSLGLVLLPQLASLLQDRYSSFWGFFIMGAVALHAPVLAMLLHPVQWHRGRPRHPPQGTLGTRPLTGVGCDKCQLPRGSSVPMNIVELSGDQKSKLTYPVIPKRFRTCSESQSGALLSARRGSTFSLGGSTFLTGSVLTLHEHQDNTVSEEGGDLDEDPAGPWRRVWRQFRAQYNIHLMADPLAAGTALITCFSISGAVNIFATIPFVLGEAGYSLQDTATAMSVAALVDLFTRLVLAVIVDLPRADARFIYSLGQLIYITVPFVLLYQNERWWAVLACMAVLGVGLGIFYVLDMLLLVRVLGADRLSQVLGLSQFFRCVTFTTLGPVGGELRDATGSFVGTVTFMSGLMVVGLAILTATTLATTTTRCLRLARHRPASPPSC